MRPGPYRLSELAQDLIDFLERVAGGPARLVGYRSLPDSELAVVPGTSHVGMLEKPWLVTGVVAEFLTTAPVPTMIPIRRAAG